MAELTEAEIERLVVLIEACAEVQVTAGKILRDGFEKAHPDDPDISDRELLTYDIGNMIAAADLVCHHDVDVDAVISCTDTIVRTEDRRLKYNTYPKEELDD